MSTDNNPFGWVRVLNDPWQAVDERTWIIWERAAGFSGPKGHAATNGFTGSGTVGIRNFGQSPPWLTTPPRFRIRRVWDPSWHGYVWRVFFWFNPSPDRRGFYLASHDLKNRDRLTAHATWAAAMRDVEYRYKRSARTHQIFSSGKS